MLKDVRHLTRSLRRAPASACAAVLTLSLALGAGGSIFAVVHTVVLTPPPFSNPDALVVLGETPIDTYPAARRTVSYATFEAWRDRATSQAVLEAVDGTNLTLTELGPAERLTANDVTPGFLALLGVTPVIGRGFEPADIGRPVVLVSDAFWRTKLAADPDVVGRQLVLGTRPHTIVGVLPAHFLFELNLSAVWRPLPLLPAEAARTGYRVTVVGRLATNVSPASLRDTLDDVSRASTPSSRAVAVPIRDAISGGASRMLGALGGAAALAVLIASANFAGLLIVRTMDRRRELAVRTALGARPADIAKQVLLEAHVLVAIGTLGGVLLALWIAPVVGHLALQQFGGVAHRDVAVGWRIIGAMAVAASGCAWIGALLPSLMAARGNVLDVLRRGATPAGRELTWRRLFVAGEVALAFVLIVCVTLLGRGLFGVLGVHPGFDPRGVLALQVSLPAAGYPDAARIASFYTTLQHALDDRLGPGAAAIVDELPLTGVGARTVVGLAATDAAHEAVIRTASAGYFDVMRIPVVAGRALDGHDSGDIPARVVVSESLAERLFGSEQPLGRQVRLAGPAGTAEIVGVVGDVAHRTLDEPVLPTIYRSALQAPSPSSIVVVRHARPDLDVIAAVRSEVARLDSNLPVYGVRSMQQVVAASPGVPARRVLTAAFLGFALLAVVLGAVGLFGVIAHEVAARRGELALRIALGADPGRIVRATLRQAGLLVGTGLAAGGVLSVWAARALAAAGFASNGADPLSVFVAAAVLGLTAAAAVLPAARRAARTDPLMALRSD